VPHSITQADTGKAADKRVAKAIKERDEALKKVGWLEKQLKLTQVQTPSGGAVSNPSTSPVTEIPAPVSKDSVVKVPVLYPYDYPFSVTVGKNSITILTINPYLRYYNVPYTKLYEYDRTTSDFQFALTPSVSSSNLDGVVLKANQRFLSFDGITAGAGAMFPKNFYALLEMKFSMYERLHIDPRVTSIPEIGLELKYDIIK
jgi:hypothetical protein